MPEPRAKVRVTAAAQGNATVNVYRPNGSTLASAWTTQTGSTAHSFPVTVSAGASTNFWVGDDQTYVVSVKYGSTEVANGYGATWSGVVSNDGILVAPEYPVLAGGGGGGGGASAVTELTDVDLTGLADGDGLTWDTGTSKWGPAAVLPVTPGSPNNGDVLTYSTGSGTYAPAAPGGSSFGAHYVTGEYIVPIANQTSTFNYPSETMYLCPVMILKSVTLDQIVCSISSAAPAGGIVRMGIYEGNAAGLPTTLLVEGTVTSTTGGTRAVTISQTLAPGLYWLAYVAQGPPGAYPTVTYVSVPGTSWFFLSTSAAVGGGSMVYKLTGVTGALPTPLTGLAKQNNCPLVSLRVA
jgi:hypothetical protein